jgi:hypothetical protein
VLRLLLWLSVSDHASIAVGCRALKNVSVYIEMLVSPLRRFNGWKIDELYGFVNLDN